MQANPADEMDKFLVETFYSRLESMADDLQACLKLFNSWKRKYKNETSADLKKQVEEEVQKVRDTFRIYRDAFVRKGKHSSLIAFPHLAG